MKLLERAWRAVKAARTPVPHSSAAASAAATAVPPGRQPDVVEVRGTTDACTVVCFTGYVPDYAQSEGFYEFQNSMADLRAQRDVSTVFLRDRRNHWFRDGSTGIEGGAAGLRRYLGALRARSRRLVVIGNSMGAHAALLYGPACGADLTLAISPQTFIDPPARAEQGDGRWPREMAEIAARHGGDGDLDLAGLAAPGAVVFYGGLDRLDIVHAERLQGAAALVRIDDCTHESTAAYLRNRNVPNALVAAVMDDLCPVSWVAGYAHGQPGFVVRKAVARRDLRA